MGILPMISESDPVGGTPMLLFPNVAERRNRFVSFPRSGERHATRGLKLVASFRPQVSAFRSQVCSLACQVPMEISFFSEKLPRGLR